VLAQWSNRHRLELARDLKGQRLCRNRALQGLAVGSRVTLQDDVGPPHHGDHAKKISLPDKQLIPDINPLNGIELGLLSEKKDG